MREVTLQTRIAKRGEIVSGQVDGDTVMMSIENGRYYTLNPTAGRIWALLERPQTVSELCAALTDEFRIEPAACHKEVMDFISQLADRDIIIIDQDTIS